MKTKACETSLLNQEETAALYNLSRRKFYRLLQRERNLPFLVFYKTRRLILRDAFEAYLAANPEVKEELKNGKPPVSKTKGREAQSSAHR